MARNDQWWQGQNAVKSTQGRGRQCFLTRKTQDEILAVFSYLNSRILPFPNQFYVFLVNPVSSPTSFQQVPFLLKCSDVFIIFSSFLI